MRPSSVPAYSKPFCTGDSTNETMVPNCEVETSLATASALQYLPITFHVLRSICAVRSSLITSQLLPRLIDLNTLLAAQYRVLWSCGLRIKGVFQFHL